MILALKEALDWLGERRDDQALRAAGQAIESAVKQILVEGAPLTYDMVGLEKAAPTSAVGAAVAARVSELLA
jgi:isocitrate/isopropylmalate dehydrogenase